MKDYFERILLASFEEYYDSDEEQYFEVDENYNSAMELKEKLYKLFDSHMKKLHTKIERELQQYSVDAYQTFVDTLDEIPDVWQDLYMLDYFDKREQ